MNVRFCWPAILPALPAADGIRSVRWRSAGRRAEPRARLRLPQLQPAAHTDDPAGRGTPGAPTGTEVAGAPGGAIAGCGAAGAALLPHKRSLGDRGGTPGASILAGGPGLPSAGGPAGTPDGRCGGACGRSSEMCAWARTARGFLLATSGGRNVRRRRRMVRIPGARTVFGRDGRRSGTGVLRGAAPSCRDGGVRNRA